MAPSEFLEPTLAAPANSPEVPPPSRPLSRRYPRFQRAHVIEIMAITYDYIPPHQTTSYRRFGGIQFELTPAQLGFNRKKAKGVFFTVDTTLVITGEKNYILV
jgi:hypothetical protein